MAILVYRNPKYYDKDGNPKPEMDELYSQSEVLAKKKQSGSLKATLSELEEQNRTKK